MIFGPTQMRWPSFRKPFTSFQNYQVGLIRTTETRSHLGHHTQVPPKSPTFESFTQVGLTKFLVQCHRVESKGSNGWILGEGYLYPSTPSYYLREPSERKYTSTIHFLRKNYLLMCWDQEIPFLPFEPWFLAFPKLLSTQILLPP